MEKISKNIGIVAYIIVGLTFVFGSLLPVKFANAACAPRVSVFKATPLQTSKKKPKVSVTLNLTNLNTCTEAEKNNLIMYISADGVDSDVNLPSPLEFLFTQGNDFTLTIDFPDPFEPDGKSERLNWPAITYKAYIAKKGRVTTIGDVVFTYNTPVVFKNLDYTNGTSPATSAATSTAPTPPVSTKFEERSYDGVDWEGSLDITNPSGAGDISELITKLINWLLLIIAMVATIVIIISGIMLVFNGGSESTIKKAKTTILWAVIGLVVSIGAFALVNIVQSLL